MEYYGLIGYPLSHTFSPNYFNKKFSDQCILAEYSAYSLEKIEEFVALTEKKPFKGINVTIPYKEKVIHFLDEIDNIANEIGAVNTIKFVDGKTIGYNTDVYGFELSLLDLITSTENVQGALILGSGGASKAVEYVLAKLKIPYIIVSRRGGEFTTYEQLDKKMMQTHNLIINTTPLGMHPKSDTKPEIPYTNLTKNYFLYDLVYNPEKTIFLSEGLSKGCRVKNGYDMLILQAEKSWEIWNTPEIQ